MSGRSMCFVCLQGILHWVASRFAPGSGNALGVRLCRMETFEQNRERFFVCVFICKQKPLPFSNPVLNGLFLPSTTRVFCTADYIPRWVSLSEIILGNLCVWSTEMIWKVKLKKKKRQTWKLKAAVGSSKIIPWTPQELIKETAINCNKGRDGLSSESQPEAREMFHYLFH